MGDKEKTMGTVNKIYIIHGWSYNLDQWKKIISLLKAEKINASLLKIPGLTDRIDKEWNITDYVGWLNKILSKEQKPITLIGHSNGGRIALNYALNYPPKISHLILIDSAGIYHNDLRIKVKRFIFKIISHIGKLYTSSPQLKNLLYKITREHDYNQAGSLMKKTMVNLLNSDKNLKLSNVKLPVTLIWGRLDQITPLSDGQLMQKNIKGAKLHTIESARHSPQFSHPEEVTNIITEAIKL